MTSQLSLTPTAEERHITNLAKEHAFRRLSESERAKVAQDLLRLAEDPRPRWSLREVLEELGNRHIFAALSIGARREAAGVLLEYARQERRVQAAGWAVRVRIDPTATALSALSKEHVFQTLSRDESAQAALVFLKYAAEEVAFDSVDPQGWEGRYTGIKRGLEGLARKHVFLALSAEDQRRAAWIFLRYAERPASERSLQDDRPFEDLYLGVKHRAMKGLSREFVLAALSNDEQLRARALIGSH